MTTSNRGAGKMEHILVDRIVPILLIVIFPMLGAIWFLDDRQHTARRDQLREACERGNDIRRDQRFVFGYLIETGQVLSVGASDPSVRDYYARAAENLRKRSGNLKIVDCHNVIR